MKAEIKTVLVLGGVLVLGWLAQATQAGKGIEDFLGGIGRGISTLLSPQIHPSIVLETGIKVTSDVCWPWWPLFTPCTVSSRGTGALPGGGSASAGFLPNYPYTDSSGRTWLSSTSYLTPSSLT